MMSLKYNHHRDALWSSKVAGTFTLCNIEHLRKGKAKHRRCCSFTREPDGLSPHEVSQRKGSEWGLSNVGASHWLCVCICFGQVSPQQGRFGDVGQGAVFSVGSRFITLCRVLYPL